MFKTSELSDVFVPLAELRKKILEKSGKDKDKDNRREVGKVG